MGETESEKQAMIEHFKNNVVGFNAVEQALMAKNLSFLVLENS